MLRLLSIIILILWGTTSPAQNNNQALKDSIDYWLSFQSDEKYNLSLQLQFAKKALKASQENAYEIGTMKSHLALGMVYLNRGYYAETLENLQKADSFAYTLNALSSLMHCKYLMGNTHNYLSNSKVATNYYLEALKIQKEANDNVGIGLSLAGIGLSFIHLGKLDSALVYYNKSSTYLKDIPELNFHNVNNIATIFLEQKHPKKALLAFQETLTFSYTINDKKGEAIALANMGIAHRQLKQYDKAFSLSKQALSISKKLGYSRITYDIYKDIAETYQELKQNDSANSYFQKYHTLKNLTQNDASQRKIAELQVLYQSERKNRQLIENEEQIRKLEKQKKIDQLWIFVIGLVLVSLISLGGMLFVWLSLKNRQKKALNLKNEELLQTQRLVLQKELEKKELITEHLQQELEYKNKDLTNFALDIARKNEFTSKILNELRRMDTGRNKKLRELISYTTNHFQINKTLEKLQFEVEKVNQEFYSTLTQKHPSLTPHEHSLCAFIRLNLNTKDIAAIRNVEIKSVEMSRYRLRKKLKISPEVNLSLFLQEL